ncbi:MAG: hypothetical protein A2Y02_03540 [Omnitrophica bacterium GWA2_52_12]|nr:MAG: hypothetical protein A2Y02_03540 [Omnitrophica bacterium GWA2_52_12]
MKKVSICIHGHFYQPPRENAWIEDIESQESAHPFHDWNERIYHECYRPNTRSRILGPHHQIVRIVNNFERMSFNIGPTLFSWLENKHPEAYRRILDADKTSLKAHHGHGNALAQVYNHMIMPLANLRDKKTQVRWGIEEFRHRFKRNPEGFWLSETAVNEETLEVLADEGVKFTILAPHQAEAFKPLDEGAWQDVSNGSIDPKKPYRCFLKRDPSRFVDIFFYDGPISKACAFEDLLSDAKNFMNRLEGAMQEPKENTQLIHAAMDGETFGHHKSWADRALSYLLFTEAEARGYRIVNYGEYLEENPPQAEVRLKAGENGEGTSWSCAHGVRRWKEHCGCRGGGPAEWRQEWRKPLRESLDWLRDELAAVYLEKAAPLLKDPWAARDDYIRVLLNRTEQTIRPFFDQHAGKALSDEERSLCLKLLEMQRHAQLMYTSCGWFFTEISGIETVQILQYAARACQLAAIVRGPALEEQFLARLTKARSNVELFRDGRGVYEKLVKPCVATLEHVVSYYAIGSLFDHYALHGETLNLYFYDLKVLHRRKEIAGNLLVHFGRVQVVSRVTLEQDEFIFVTIRIGHYDFRCSVKRCAGVREMEAFETDVFDALTRMHLLEFLKKIDDTFGVSYFALKDLLQEDRTKIVTALTKTQLEKVSNFYERVYEENRPIHAIYNSVNLPVPEEFRYAAEHVLTKRLNEALQSLAAQGFSLRKAAPLYHLMDAAKAYHVEIQKKTAAHFMACETAKRAREFAKTLNPDLLRECIYILKLSRRLGIEFECPEAQDELFALQHEWRSSPEGVPAALFSHSAALLQLFSRLQLSTHELKKFFSKAENV